MKAPKVTKGQHVNIASEHPIYMKKGGTVPEKKSGGIKGYVTGGNIQEDVVRDPNYRKYKTDFKSGLHDAALGVADMALAPLAPNAIKGSDYKTKTGEKFNTVSSYYGQGVKQVGGAVLNYYVPGLGTAINSATDVVGGNFKDDSITTKDQNNINKIHDVGTAIGGISGMFKKPTTTHTTTDTATTPVTQQVQATTSTLPQTTYDETKFNSAQASIWRTPGVDKAALYKEWGYAEGGQIKGPGTGISDSIKTTKLQPRGFIVPAENAHHAIAIREKYLGQNKTAIV